MYDEQIDAFLDPTKICVALHDTATGGHVGVVTLDFRLTGRPADHAVHCLLSYVQERSGTWDLSCLVLVPVEKSSDVFRRMGVARITEERWFGQLSVDETSSSSSQLTDQTFIRTITLV